ncbi:MAG: antitoxin family protein [Anaerolineae bacterium]|nr:antitoxin family protein [Anaerolineae bacterium]
MIKTVSAIFEEGVLRPESPVDLEPNKRYILTIQDEPKSDSADVWDILARLSGTVEAPPDWASEHDHYLYGMPRRNDAPTP